MTSQIAQQNKMIPLIGRDLTRWKLCLGTAFLLEIKAIFILIHYKEASLSHISSSGATALNVISVNDMFIRMKFDYG